MSDHVKVKLYLLCRNLADSPVGIAIKASKHWALLIDHYYENENGQLEIDTQVIIEGVQNQRGELEARMIYGNREVHTWEQNGFKKRALQANGEYKELPAANFAATYLSNFNRHPPKYRLVYCNCQCFVRDFLAAAALEDAIEMLPENAQQSKGNFLKRSSLEMSKGSFKLVFHAFPTLLQKCSKEFAEFLAKEGVETGLEDVLKAVIKRFIQNCAEEVAENLARGLAGAVSPWQLLQIPVEILTYLICKFAGLDETFAYDLSKLASLITTAGVGFVVGSPVGLGAAVLFWVVGEIVAWLIRKLFDFASSGKYSKYFGDSQTEALLKRIWVNVKRLAANLWNWLKTLYTSGWNWIKRLLSSPQAQRAIEGIEAYNVTL